MWVLFLTIEGELLRRCLAPLKDSFMNESVLINATYFRNRLSELGLKQWWIADQIGVDRKTVSRWLQGQVRSAQIDNVRRLCEVLACQLNDIVLDNEADSFATVEDQKTAANIMLNSSLIEKLGAIGEWDAIEGLLRSCLIPSKPIKDHSMRSIQPTYDRTLAPKQN